MGERQFLIEYIQRMLQVHAAGRGSAKRVPYERTKDAECVVVIREAQIALNEWLAAVSGARNDAELVRRIRETVAADVNSVKADNFEYFLIFDNAAAVTVAKRETQQKRDEAQHKAGKKPYTDEECEAFFNVEKMESAEAAENATPDMSRLRITKGKGKRECMERFAEFVQVAIMGHNFGAREFSLILVIGGKKISVFHSEDGGEDQQGGFDWDNVIEEEPPKGVAEAEALCLHYAFDSCLRVASCMEKLMVVVLCADTDAFMLGLLNMERICDPSLKEMPEIWLDLTPASMRKKLRENADVKTKYNYAIELCSTYVNFTRLVCKQEPVLKCFDKNSVLPMLELVASLGGTDKVEKRDQCTSEALFKALLNEDRAATLNAKCKPLYVEPLDDFDSEAEAAEKQHDSDDEKTPMQEWGEERLAKRRRVALNEEVLCDFALRAYAAAKFAGVSARVENILDSAELADETYNEALQVMREAEQKSYEIKMKQYPKQKEKREAEIEKYKIEKLAGLSEDSKEYKVALKKMPKPLEEPKHNYRPHDDASEVRALARRCRYQLIETLNAVSPGAVPDAKQTNDDGVSLWGWKANGERTNDIVPYSPSVQLYS